MFNYISYCWVVSRLDQHDVVYSSPTIMTILTWVMNDLQARAGKIT